MLNVKISYICLSMKAFFHKILSISMALAVLISTISFTVNKHFCGETLVDTSIFRDAKSCGMEMSETTTISGCSVMKKNCCTNEQIVIQGQDELKISFDKISFEQQVFLVALVYTYFNLFEEYDKDISSFKEYKPPLVIRQIYKIDETYLI